jgi:pyruvate carboxylase
MKSLLVANRSEIAIRCFRAATELGLHTVAVYTHEDRFSLHRFKADEGHLIGPPTGGAPVRGYLDIEGIVALAKEVGADAIHPGYGFLAENAAFARACEQYGIAFVGPAPEHLELFGDKTSARRLADTVGIPTIPGTETALADRAEIRSAASAVGYPLMVKASFGGGGRGMRVVAAADELDDKLDQAQREATTAFGRGEVFLERYVARAKHIEVQVLGDASGNLVHLWERDCSVQRRHQKVVEIAPASSLPIALRRRICDAAVALCAPIKYRGAGTVEFLVDVDTGAFYFIEVNPRIQVEHTVTEVVTGIDLVKSQILIAAGHRLHEAPLNIPRQEQIEARGTALQCRITTEDPTNQFVPDYGRISTYRSPGGFAVRLDGGNGFSGAVVSPYFDSLLVKMTTWGSTLEEAVARTERSLREFRIRGVKTNIAFLLALVRHQTFVSGAVTTTFVDNTPELFQGTPTRDRASKILSYLADVIVNGRPDVKTTPAAGRILSAPTPPRGRRSGAPPPGTRQMLQQLGPERFCEWIRAERRLLVTDTTMRDAHQSLLATRMRTYDMLGAADTIAHDLPNLFSLETWGGATFDTAMRFLQEDPWDRLTELRTRIPNVLFQMLLRASNAVGYTNYPDNVVQRFIQQSATSGVDLFRIFDSLNSAENMRVAVEAVRTDTPALCEAAICYTGDLLDPTRTKFTLTYYVGLAKALVAMGTHILGIKDMAGLCKPHAARILVAALRDEVGVPIHFHTHDTSGINAASILQAADAGVDIADMAIASMSGLTSQPSMNSLAAALRHTERDTGLDQAVLDRLSVYWSDVRDLYYPFEEGLRAPAPDVYHHEMPGGQFTNLRQQARSLGLDGRWAEVCDAYAAANLLLGDIVKVTPSSKVVGDLALFMVTNDLEAEDLVSPGMTLGFPRSVVELLQGMLGRPHGGWPPALQQKVLASASVVALTDRPGATLPPANFGAVAAELATKTGPAPRDEDVLSYLMYPQAYLDLAGHFDRHGDTSRIRTEHFFYPLQPGEETSVEIERGKTLIIRYLTTGEARADGTRTVFFELNGQPREVTVTDRSAPVTVERRRKVDVSNGNHIGAPMPGKIVAVAARKGDLVRAGQRLLSIEAMKMETAVYSPREGRISDVLVDPGATVDARDLLVVLA